MHTPTDCYWAGVDETPANGCFASDWNTTATGKRYKQYNLELIDVSWSLGHAFHVTEGDSSISGSHDISLVPRSIELFPSPHPMRFSKTTEKPFQYLFYIDNRERPYEYTRDGCGIELFATSRIWIDRKALDQNLFDMQSLLSIVPTHFMWHLPIELLTF